MTECLTGDIRAEIREMALAENFDVVGFASAQASANDRAALAAFVKNGWHGDMKWLAGVKWSTDNPRGNPKALMEDVRSIIVLGTNYGPGVDPLHVSSQPDRGAISVYARPPKDYHDVIKKRLKRLGRQLVERFPDAGVKVFVDTAPVMEKPLAARTDIGWQGKHTNLVSRQFGSWLFLAEIFITLDIPPDLPEPDHCGSCDLCLKACPTDAFPAPGQLDARRCISYLTIEHKGAIDPDLMAAMGNRIYGCDDCLAVCPWNKFSEPAVDPAFLPRDDLAAPRLAQLARLDEAQFKAMFAGSPIKRTGHERFLRNIAIAIGNSGDATLLEIAEMLSRGPSQLVAETARWATARLSRLDARPAADNHERERTPP